MSAVRSASAVAALAAALLSGCATTQQEAARLRLNSARIRVSQVTTRVTRPDRSIKVESVRTLSSGHGTAVVVAVHNRSGATLTDLPILVGIGRPRHTRYLNGRPGGDYFQSHISAIAPGATLNWVLTTRAQIKTNTRMFALVGAPQRGFSHARTLPRIEVYTAARTVKKGVVQVAVRNLTATPQYDLQVYGTAVHSNRLVAAGSATVAHLGGEASATLRMRLLGRTTGARAALQAPATIFG